MTDKVIYHIKIEKEMLLEFLRGKELHYVTFTPIGKEEIEFVIQPPFDGVILTYEEIEQIRVESAFGPMASRPPIDWAKAYARTKRGE